MGPFHPMMSPFYPMKSPFRRVRGWSAPALIIHYPFHVEWDISYLTDLESAQACRCSLIVDVYIQATLTMITCICTMYSCLYTVICVTGGEASPEDRQVF